ncbi:hypothetical protein ILYODFUR_009884 [Ilyodon furcidens]|uniref:Uncharacterized protein n=1 Tax=Ilyodon furcidens TaxID=33524 RepID=A0ABV0VFG0_9TELE
MERGKSGSERAASENACPMTSHWGRVPQQARGETDGGPERQLPRWRDDTNHLRLAVCSRKLSFSYHHCL